ncbi:conserved Plasmodium protein, unknown function [Plasmodium gallinaceum]|uniref:Uncharacterized protein n=1 Tax=Plasmodium gallinaceum TaxID=5849 RepID=A0A1J1GUM0_PLAGA|nr:conserved Plasmodium protein, unknown function [Plasmodium gallinaceum]CRG95939.1 conserved Plasmodium protein, unknown function [Plasmodium gallinaceum]
MDSNNVLDLNDVKCYYNKVFTNELLLSLEKEIKIEDLIFSYSYYSNLLGGNENFDKHEIENDYLKSDDEIINSNNYLIEENKMYMKKNTYDSEGTLNYFDPYITEEEFEEKIEKTFYDLNNILKSSYTENKVGDFNKVDLNEVLQNLKVEKVQEYYQIFELRLEKNQMYQIILIMIAFIIRSIFNLSLGRKLIFSNKNINNILLRALYIQNIYIQIFTLRNIKKYIIEDGEYCDKIHLKMLKICIFSKSLCSFNRANEIILLLVKENKKVNEIFDFYFLKKLKKSLEKSDNIQRLRLLDFITDNINLNNEAFVDIFQVNKKKCYNNEIENLLKDDKSDATHLSIIYKDDQNLENFTFDSDYENCTFNDISFVDQNCVKEMMNKYCLKLNDICKMIKINIYKYLHMIYLKDDLLLKINVLEIFSKLIKNIYYCDAVSENINFLHTVLNDLKKSNEEILHLNILNSIISYSKINPLVLSFILNSHSNILMKTTIQFLCDCSMNVEKIIVGIKSFGYFFSIKESCEILLKLNPNIHLISIEKISSHSHVNVLRHSINIWLRIIPSKSMDFVWFKDLIHNILFEKIITILKEIDDILIQINIYNLLEIMINYDICDLLLKEQWLIKSLLGNFENNSYELKMSRYNFFMSFYKANKTSISNNSYADNIINNFIKNTPKRY